MNWRLPLFGSGQQQQPTPNNYQDVPAQSWYPPSVLSSSSRPPTTEGSSSSNIGLNQKPPEHSHSLSHGQVSPADAARIEGRLKELSVDELRKLLSDKDAYSAFFNSLEQVKGQNNLRDELRKGTLQLVKENLEKEQSLLELRNQCTIIRTTELAAALDRLDEYLRQKDEILRLYSPVALLGRLKESMGKSAQEAEAVYKKLHEKEIDVATFVQNYKKLRTDYHRKSLIELGAQTSRV